MINLLGKRYVFFVVSLLIIIPGLVLAATGLNLGIDFTGGSLLEVSFSSGDLPQPADVVALLTDLGIQDALVQTTDQNTLVMRFPFLDEVEESLRESVLSGQFLADEFNNEITVLRFDSVGPTVGQEVAGRAAIAVAIAAAAVVIYVGFVFRGLPHAFRYGICAIIAMIHDVAIVISLGAIGGRLFGWQIDALFLTALLTVIGFSVQDKIVVFDRIRENSNIYRRLPFETLVNHSIIQTLQRSINTQLMTVEFMLLALALFGGITLREFAIILLVGLFSGTYSSIFIAAPILVVWENHEWKTWFRRRQSADSAA
jgi:preprotein translocase subunit SecF